VAMAVAGDGCTHGVAQIRTENQMWGFWIQEDGERRVTVEVVGWAWVPSVPDTVP